MPKATGWTDVFPQVEETFYWIRHKQDHADVNVGLLRDRTLLLAEGGTMSKSPRRDFEFLPASPSDFEQLAALREAARNALNMIALEADQLDTWARESVSGGWSTHQVDPMRKKADVLRREAAALREALSKGEKS